MPWAESCAMDLRVRLISEWLEGGCTVVDLAARHGVSRKTAYKWIGRYEAEGSAGLRDRSSAPLRHGRRTDAALAEAIVREKVSWPRWGPRKIIARLRDRAPEMAWPVASTAGEILKRAGLVAARRQRHRVPPTPGGLTEAERANHVWAVDHKGWVRLGDGTRCEPLTISDSYTRYLIGLSCGSSTAAAEAQQVFEQAFATYGLPETIRSDNGVPFAANGVTGLTRLTMWWAKLGIRHERTTPGCPQQNGRHERFHLTLKEAMEPPAGDREAQAERFAAFQKDYNHERPHEALGQTPPGRHYRPSPRALPERLAEPDYPATADIRRVRSSGEIKWAGRLLYVSDVLVGELVAIQEDDDGAIHVRFYDTPIATIDPDQRRLRRLSVPARGHAEAHNLSPS